MIHGEGSRLAAAAAAAAAGAAASRGSLEEMLEHLECPLNHPYAKTSKAAKAIINMRFERLS